MYCGAVEFVCSPSTVRHVPVLLDECMAYLEPSRGGNFADLTFGGGGHSKALLEANPNNSLLAMDCDPDAEVRSSSFEHKYTDRFRFEAVSYTHLTLPTILRV